MLGRGVRYEGGRSLATVGFLGAVPDREGEAGFGLDAGSRAVWEGCRVTAVVPRLQGDRNCRRMVRPSWAAIRVVSPDRVSGLYG